MIGGDGIGPEVTAEALKVVRAVGIDLETTAYDLGGARYLRDGEILSDATLDELRDFDAILLGAVGTPDVPPGVIERGLLLKMRFDLDLYVNQRPFVGTAPGHTEPHDFVVIRENTEGPYVGEGGVLRKGTVHEVATQGSVNTRMGAERAIRFAFELAVQRGKADPPGRQHVTLVHKTNVLTFSGDLWQRAFNDVAADYPQVGTAYNHVDAACIYFVQDPHRYDVVVTDFNMPGRSGLDVAREIAQVRPDLPVLISSGLVTDALREQARQAGIRAVLQKENSLEELVPLVRRALAETVAQE